MNARAFLEEARSVGLTLAVRGDALTISPAGRLTEAQREFIRAHKPAILAALTEKPAASTEGPAAPAAGGSSAPVDPARAAVPAGAGPTLPPPWDAIRDRITEGWRAEFGPPGPDGRQSITWIPPGQWEAAELHQHQHQPATHAYRLAKRATTGTASALPVRCADCRHFERDQTGDGSGIGSCRAGVPARGLPRYPKVERLCRAFLPAGQSLPNAQDRYPTELRPIPHLHSDQPDFEDTDMALTLTDSGETFELAPAGTFPARCYRVIDLGTQTTTWQGQESRSKKILLQFEICDPETRMSDGRAFSIGKRYTASLNEKAALRKDLEAWRGKSFDPQELRGFDVSKLLGQPCLLSVIHAEKGGRMYANINSLMRLPKGMPVAEASNDLLSWDFGEPDWNAFERLGQRMQAILEATPEWATVRPMTPAPMAPATPATPTGTYPFPPASAPKPAPAPAVGEDFDDDIPW